MASEEAHFRVEIWDADETRVERLVATASDVMVAIAAFDKAAEQHPEQIITMRKCPPAEPDSMPIYTVPGV